MEKPSYYDLLIDLTTSTPKATRPTFYSSKPVVSQAGSSRGPTHTLSTIRFAWSDVRLASIFFCSCVCLVKPCDSGTKLTVFFYSTLIKGHILAAAVPHPASTLMRNLNL